MNVAICSSGDLFGGVERFILTFAGELGRSRTHRVWVTLFSKGALYEALREQGIETEVFDCPRYDVTVIARLARLFRDKGIEVAHTHGYKANLLCGLAAKLSGTRIVKTEHGALEPFPLFGQMKMSANVGIDRFLSRYLIDRIVYVSKDIQERNGKYYKGIIGDVVYNGIPHSPIQSSPRPCELDANGFNLGVIGRLSAVKGHIYLLQALKTLDLPDLRLFVLGEGELKGDLEKFSHDNGLSGRVQFLGFRADAGAYVHALDAIVIPSLHEGFPYTMLEAGYSGVPLIASRVGGMQEVFTDQHECLLVEPRNVEQLQAAILKLYVDPALRQAIAENARRKVMANFLIDSMVSKYLAVYESTLNGRIH
jgi:L-malate glycosyltransferase